MSEQMPLPNPESVPPKQTGFSKGTIVFCGILIVAVFLVVVFFDDSTERLNITRNRNSGESNISTKPTSNVNVNANSKVSAKQKAEDARDLRFQLEGQYRDVMAKANPHLNYIESKTTKVKGGYAIWAVHTYFSEYSFKIGSDAPITSDWIVANWSSLHDANVVQVGLKSDNGYGGWCSLKVD